MFTIKYKPKGSIERFKVRLVAKGFSQSYGIYYHRTVVLVAKLNAIRVLLSLLQTKNGHCITFLNGDLEKEGYLEIPPCLETPSNHQMVCKLKKAL